jgi:hypothetical protein
MALTRTLLYNSCVCKFDETGQSSSCEEMIQKGTC